MVREPWALLLRRSSVETKAIRSVDQLVDSVSVPTIPNLITWNDSGTLIIDSAILHSPVLSDWDARVGLFKSVIFGILKAKEVNFPVRKIRVSVDRGGLSAVHS